MGSGLVIGAGVAEGVVLAGLLWNTFRKGGKGLRDALEKLQEAAGVKAAQSEKIGELAAQLIEFDVLRDRVVELKRLREGLKVEKGRVTITQAELETVEGRLRELEEIERELAASGIETKEELKILKRKEKELLSKNEALKSQLAQTQEQMTQLFSELEVGAQVQEEMERAKAELISCQTQIDTLLVQIEQGNDQYFIMKQRYDALDIEYAQLYEKFSEQSPQR